MVKARDDELAILGSPIDEEDLTDKVLDELDDDYRELVLAIQARDNIISFDELHEKLFTFKATLQEKTQKKHYFPVTMNPTSRHNTTWQHQNNNPSWHPTSHGHNIKHLHFTSS